MFALTFVNNHPTSDIFFEVNVILSTETETFTQFPSDPHKAGFTVSSTEVLDLDRLRWILCFLASAGMA
jgi:hypothetical protein